MAALIISKWHRAMIDTAFASPPLAFQGKKRNMLETADPRAGVSQTRNAAYPCDHVTPVNDADLPVRCALMANRRKRGLLRVGRSSADIHHGILPAAGDIILGRQFSISGLAHTDFERMLRARQIDTVVLAGVSIKIALRHSPPRQSSG